MKTFLNYCFLCLKILLIHAVFTALSFGNLWMMTSSSTLPCFFMQFWVSLVNVTYTNNPSKMFPYSLVQLIMFTRIVQISSISLGSRYCVL